MPGADATALIASATIFTPTSLPLASARRPPPRSVGFIRSHPAPPPDAATLPVRNPCTLFAASIFCERSACSTFRLRILSVALKLGPAPRTTSASASSEPPNALMLKGRAYTRLSLYAAVRSRLRYEMFCSDPSDETILALSLGEASSPSAGPLTTNRLIRALPQRIGNNSLILIELTFNTRLAFNGLIQSISPSRLTSAAPTTTSIQPL